jgi:hypothetical protein
MVEKIVISLCWRPSVKKNKDLKRQRKDMKNINTRQQQIPPTLYGRENCTIT